MQLMKETKDDDLNTDIAQILVDLSDKGIRTSSLVVNSTKSHKSTNQTKTKQTQNLTQNFVLFLSFVFNSITDFS
jgi:hypothetical protein